MKFEPPHPVTQLISFFKYLFKPRMWIVAFFLCAGISIYLSIDTPLMWDDDSRYSHSTWLVERILLGNENRNGMNYYAPLWELTLGALTRFAFHSFEDPYFIRHASTLFLYLFGLYLLYRGLKKVGYSTATSVLGCSAVFSIIRLGGHALFNPKDVPGAIGFLLCTVFLWIALNSLFSVKQSPVRSFLLAAWIGILSATPFLLRAPLLLHLVLIYTLSISFLFNETTGLKRSTRLVLCVLIVFSSSFLIYYLYPPMWRDGMEGLEGSLHKYQNSGWNNHSIHFFGKSYSPRILPWWYAFGWLPIISTSVLFVLSCCGFMLAIVKPSAPECRLRIAFLKKTILNMNFMQWLCIFVILSWSAVIIMKPTLYDEERHILFLYPTFFLLCILGFNCFSEKVKAAIACILIVSALFSYNQWGQYSYIYTSRLAGPPENRKLTGDYWGICIAESMREIENLFPADTTIAVDPKKLGSMQQTRLQKSKIIGNPSYGPYKIVDWKPKKEQYAAVIYNRTNSPQNTLKKLIEQDEMEFVWSSKTPVGDDACIIAATKGLFSPLE